MKKKAYLVHGWMGNTQEAFIPWLEQQLVSNGFEVVRPALPNPELPQYDAWLECLKKSIEMPDGETLIVGHSLGSRSVLGYLQDLPEGALVGRVILVAAPILSFRGESFVSEEVQKPWFERSIDAEKIRHVAPDMVLFFSDLDPLIPAENEECARKVLGFRTIIEPGKGHYLGLGEGGAVPKILEEALKPFNCAI